MLLHGEEGVSCTEASGRTRAPPKGAQGSLLLTAHCSLFTAVAAGTRALAGLLVNSDRAQQGSTAVALSGG